MGFHDIMLVVLILDYQILIRLWKNLYSFCLPEHIDEYKWQVSTLACTAPNIMLTDCPCDLDSEVTFLPGFPHHGFCTCRINFQIADLQFNRAKQPAHVIQRAHRVLPSLH